MFALKNNIAVAMLIVALAGIHQVQGQQLPSQRYTPTRDQAISAPPSVHVPPQHARQLPNAQSNYPRPAFEGTSQARGTTYNFSDQAGNTPAQHAASRRSQVVQTSYQSESKGEPEVPAILAGKPNPSQQMPSRSPMASSTPFHKNAKTPSEYAAQMTQLRGDTPKIAPNEFHNGQAVKKEIADFQQKAMAQHRMAANTAQFDQPANSNTAGAAQIAKTSFAETTTKSSPEQSTEKSYSNTNPIQLKSPATDITKDTMSASDFIAASSAGNDSTGETTATSNNTTAETPTLVAQRIKDTPATTRINASESMSRGQVSTVSVESDVQQASINLSAPALSVETFGPQTVGINKPATYKVVVTNNGSRAAERILVGIDLPEWVDLENINMTTGGKEIASSTEQARLVWSVDRVDANSKQTISITAVPRKAEVFGLNIEWTLVPRTGAANVQVTQPKLEMNIVGPDEVLYGEEALYHVTVRNPGTGTAENVIVMLPEALGGERASLGDIPAGKDKNFQVELLARTAGQLNLITTAVADGNLEVSSDRDLVVRRANLGIAIEGPQLKYAGSVGQYFVQVTNTGDAIANEIVAAIALPNGVKYLGGIDSVKVIEGGLRWQVGSLDPGQTREYKINCQLDTSGDLQLEVGAQGKGDLQAAHACLTKVETVADLVLTVNDPKGPLPTGQDTVYEISVRNRGTKSAKGVDLVMQFSDGIEPTNASGLEHRIVPGQVLFAPITKIEPGQEISFKVNAEASKAGTHIFRAQLTCEEADSREIAEGTTKFFGEEIRKSSAANTADSKSSFGGGSQDFSPELKR